MCDKTFNKLTEEAMNRARHVKVVEERKSDVYRVRDSVKELQTEIDAITRNREAISHVVAQQ